MRGPGFEPGSTGFFIENLQRSLFMEANYSATELPTLILTKYNGFLKFVKSKPTVLYPLNDFLFTPRRKSTRRSNLKRAR